MEDQGHFRKNSGRQISMKPRPRYQVSVYRTNGPLVIYFFCQRYLKKVCMLRLVKGKGLLYVFVCRDIMLFGSVKS